MANSDKNIVITPNRNLSGIPEIAFTGFGNSSLTLSIPDSTTGTLEFRSGINTVFSIDSNVSSGSLFSVTNEYSQLVLDVSTSKITISSNNGKVYFDGNKFLLSEYAFNSLPINAPQGSIVFDTTNSIPRYFNESRWAPLGNQKSGTSPETAGNSALQILQDYPDSINGSYWILIDDEPIEVYCDMSAIAGGGWTLIGKSRGTWNSPNVFLKKNTRLDEMFTNFPMKTNGTFACINSVNFCVNKATEICFSNHSLSRWVRCPMHTGRNISTLFGVEAGYSTINTSASNNSQLVTATAWNAVTQSVYVNPYMVMAWSSHGGSFPAWTMNQAGNANVSEYAMACSVTTGSHNGFTSGSTHNGMDAPSDQGDFGWPNSSYNSAGAYMLIFAR